MILRPTFEILKGHLCKQLLPGLSLLINGAAVPADLIPNRITVLAALVVGVALHRVNAVSLNALHNPYMVGRTVLAAIPIEKDDVAGTRLIVPVLPEPAIPEPLRTLHTACEFWNRTGVGYTRTCWHISSQSRHTIPPALRSHTSSSRVLRPHCRPERAPR